MHLREARVCLDCEEIHNTSECPVCASESFAFVSRWVPSQHEHRIKPRATVSPDADTYRRLLVADAVRPKAVRLLKRGAVGLAVISLGRWLWRQSGSPIRRDKKEPAK